MPEVVAHRGRLIRPRAVKTGARLGIPGRAQTLSLGMGEIDIEESGLLERREQEPHVLVWSVADVEAADHLAVAVAPALRGPRGLIRGR